MRPEHKAIRQRQNIVVNAKNPPADQAMAYAGPVFGPSNLAPSIGMQCKPLADAEPPTRTATPSRLTHKKWHCHAITLGTGWGTFFTLRQSGHVGDLHLSGELTLRGPRDQSLVQFDDVGEFMCACDNYLVFADARIALKPRALALAIRWLEAHGMRVTRVECSLPF